MEIKETIPMIKPGITHNEFCRSFSNSVIPVRQEWNPRNRMPHEIKTLCRLILLEKMLQ